MRFSARSVKYGAATLLDALLQGLEWKVKGATQGRQQEKRKNILNEMEREHIQ